eukprot:TRINITY_DN217_c0_g1_i1.p1 TRINITY_DN217_c0_g1~~TRINITY_DN217_c0_g1_i1.p1  ORF type:complete len:387 (+),score=111.59 TRINITY_DN217_c0_g1_i1:127-1287(+)
MDEDTSQDSNLKLAQKLFLLRSPDVPDIEKQDLKDEILEAVGKDELALMYESFCEEFGWSLDQARLEKIKKKTAEEQQKLDERLADAEENLGESEVREALLAKALYLVRVGEKKEKVLEAFRVTEEKTVAVGQKMDLMFEILKLGFFYLDFPLIAKSIEKAKSLFAEGGDWERKNRLKVYEGLYLMTTRQFKQAAELFLDSISTFTTYELFSYNTFVLYTVLVSIISLDRPSLSKKVVDAPEILTIIGEIPHLADFLNSLYGCQYKKFFIAFAGLTDQIRTDRYLLPHFRYYMKEVRVIAYSQFLESYKSVTIQAMAKAFGVSIDFLDMELSRFIAMGRLNCKIDKVGGVLETNRPDAKNALYQATIKQGDILLNRIQKLSKVIDM